MNDLHGSKHGLALTSYVLQKAGYSEKARLVYADLKAQATSNGISLFFTLTIFKTRIILSVSNWNKYYTLKRSNLRMF